MTASLSLILSSIWCWLWIPPRSGVFVFDVLSDVINGVNFINNGDPIWGSVIIATTFLPATCLLVVGAIIWFLDDKVSCYQRVIFFILLPLLGPFATAFATPAYIFYVVFVFVRKLKDPSYVSNHADFFFRMNAYRGKSRFAQPADLLKVVEALLEANIQAIIGTCLLHNQYFSTSVFLIGFPKIIYV